MANLHLIIGEDDYLVAETAKKIVGDGVGLEVIDSANSGNADQQLRDIREADASFATPPFLDPRKVTWWKHVHFLPGGGKRGVAEEVKAALEKLAAKLAARPLPANQHFILSGPHLLKTSVFAKTLAPVAETVVFAAGKPWEAARNAAVRVLDFAAELGLKFAPGVAEQFVSVVGTDSRSLMSELGKMRDYLGGESAEITAADVESVTSQGVGVEAEVWDVTDAIGRRDLAAALAALRKFELESGFAVFMSGIIEKFFRQLIDVRNGKTDGMAPFAVRKHAGFLRNWSPAELRAARARFLMLREQVVSGTTSGDVLVVSTLVRVMRRRPGR
ncbi:MAG: DNA polymerase III subunit delta [Kiritimatiellia bacterium]